MSRSSHPIEHEELMAYLDGELATDRAVAAAAHLERCQECQELTAELRKISQELMTWEVEDPESLEISTDVAVALEQKKEKKDTRKRPSRKVWGILLTPRRLAWGGGSAVILLLAFFAGVSRLRPAPSALWDAHGSGGKQESVQTKTFGPEYGRNSGSINGPLSHLQPENAETMASKGRKPSAEDYYLVDKLQSLNKATEDAADDESSNNDRTSNVPAVPMIARVAGLTLTTSEFEKTRASLEEILKRYHGYLGDLKVSAPADAGRSLTATLRIPALQLDAAMAELKTLGRMENEAQDGEEVTQQYVDLEARLKNSQHTEQRLVQMLAQRTGKLQDVLKVELEIDRVRGEIEQMQAEKKELSKRVSFATLSMIINEEYHAKLQAAPPSTGSRFHNAAVEGYNTVVEGLIDVGLFLFSAGPSLLLWAAILFFPARWAWKKVREKTRQAETSSTE
jgi:Domain of unknown function (DUF4349)